jgi:hypothetical protein
MKNTTRFFGLFLAVALLTPATMHAQQDQTDDGADGGVARQDSLALLTFYDVAEFDKNVPWRSAPVADWPGVTVRDNRVVGLNFSGGNQLLGSIPAELSQLDSLKWLFLSDNQLSGRIPSELGQLTNLENLSLAENQLSGSIPPELGQLTNLEALTLHTNELSGSIPPELGQLTNLKSLALRRNQLSGSIPSELGQITKLEILSLSNNQLSGPIPLTFTDLSSLFRFDAQSAYVCVPPTSEFLEWIDGLVSIDRHEMTPCFTSGRIHVAGERIIPYVLEISGATLDVIQNNDTDGGYLQFARRDTTPPASTFDGSAAAAPDGSTITPSTVADRYWTLSSDSLADLRFRVRLDTAGVTHFDDPDELVIMRRADSTSAWTPLATMREGDRLITEPVASFGEYAVGAEASNVPVEEAPDAPQAFALRGNAPNPFRRGTTIRYALPEKADVRLVVYDLLGRRVATLADGLQRAGRHRVRFEAADMPGGVYVYRLRSGDFTETRTMTVVR